MPNTSLVRSPWTGIPLRALVVTFLLTLLSFAVALLLSILGTIVYSAVAHVAPNLPFAYRDLAFPFAITVGAIVLVLSLTIEIRTHRKKKIMDANREYELSPSAPRIAVPVPHSGDRDYAERSLPKYEAAVRMAGGNPVRIELCQTPSQVMARIERCDAVLLPGSRADVDPQKYNAQRHPKTAPADPKRDMVDELLLQDAYNMRKPILAICYGLQALNVYRSGTLLQHIESGVDHTPGRNVVKAHTVQIEPKSKLGQIVGSPGRQPLAVNSSHHQAADVVGDGLRIVARSPKDGIIEALEGTAPDHFVLALQWHPERSVNEAPEVAESARAIFRAFIETARAKHEQRAEESEKAGSNSRPSR
jgi:putative glutamine amidotransferase